MATGKARRKSAQRFRKREAKRVRQLLELQAQQPSAELHPPPPPQEPPQPQPPLAPQPSAKLHRPPPPQPPAEIHPPQEPPQPQPPLPGELSCDNPPDNVDMMEVNFDCHPRSTADDAALKGSFQKPPAELHQQIDISKIGTVIPTLENGNCGYYALMLGLVNLNIPPFPSNTSMRKHLRGHGEFYEDEPWWAGLPIDKKHWSLDCIYEEGTNFDAKQIDETYHLTDEGIYIFAALFEVSIIIYIDHYNTELMGKQTVEYKPRQKSNYTNGWIQCPESHSKTIFLYNTVTQIDNHFDYLEMTNKSHQSRRTRQYIKDSTELFPVDSVSTADDAALRTTSCKYPHTTADDAALKGSFQDLKEVTLKFDTDTWIIDTDVLATKESMEKIDDPDDSVYVPSTNTSSCTEDEYYTFYMRRINAQKSSSSSDDFNDDDEVKNRFVETDDKNCSRQLKKRRVIEIDEESNDGLAVGDGDILSYNISEDDHHLLECVKNVLTSPRGWDSVQFVPYKTYLGGLYNLWSRADFPEMKPFIDGLLSGVGSQLDETDLEKLQHYATFLSSYFNWKTKRYEQSVQCYQFLTGL